MAERGRGRNFDDSIANHYDLYGSSSLHTVTQSKSSYLKVLEVQDWKIGVQIEIETFSLIRSWKFRPHTRLINNVIYTEVLFVSFRSTHSYRQWNPYVGFQYNWPFTNSVYNMCTNWLRKYKTPATSSLYMWNTRRYAKECKEQRCEIILSMQ
jgi:hypothetical protein